MKSTSPSYFKFYTDISGVPNTIDKNTGNLLRNKLTTEILQHLNYDPMRNKDLKEKLKCDDKTLSRRLKELKKFKLITQLEVYKGKKKIVEYTLTEKGQELINFFRNFEKDKDGR